MYEASERDYRVVVVADAISRVDQRHLDEGRGIGAVVCRSDELVGSLAACAGAPDAVHG